MSLKGPIEDVLVSELNTQGEFIQIRMKNLD